MTYKQHILYLFELSPQDQGFTCGEITKRISAHYNKTSKYLNGSISSVLRKMVKSGHLFVDPKEKGPLGGNVYKLI